MATHCNPDPEPNPNSIPDVTPTLKVYSLGEPVASIVLAADRNREAGALTLPFRPMPRRSLPNRNREVPSTTGWS